MKSNRKVIAVILMLIMVFSMASLSAADEHMNEPLVKDLVTEDGIIGTVTIWNDCEFLYVEFELNHCAIGSGWELDETDVFVGKPGNFGCACMAMKQTIDHMGYDKFHNHEDHEEGITLYTYEIPMKHGWDPCEELMIGATAIVGRDEGTLIQCEGCTTVYSDAETIVTDGSVDITYGLPAVEAYPDGNGYFDQETWDVEVGASFDEEALWIWGTPYSTLTVDGEYYWFEREIDIPYLNATGELTIAVDNAYAVYLNGGVEPILQDNILDVADLTDLTEPNVDGAIEAWSEVGYIAGVPLVHGTNTLMILGVNEQQPNGTQSSNPAGLRYQMEICWPEIMVENDEQECAWVVGEPLNCGHDMMVFPYTIFCICCDDEGQEQIKPEEPQKPMIEEATDEIVVDEVVPVEVEKSMAVKNANGRQ